jgi:2-phosphosulfolactate phosphatase
MIDLTMTRAELRPADVVIVIDVLRATTTLTWALAAGYREVICADSIERALELRAPGRILAGERGCVAPEGFDQGNSPAQAACRRGRELVLATTNGAPTIIAAAAQAPLVVCACLANLSAVADALAGEADAGKSDLLLACSGTDGAPALEDLYCAGRLSALLPGPRTDAALIAEAVAHAYPEAREALAASADAQVLLRIGQGADIDLCAQLDTLDAVGQLAWAGAHECSLVDRATLADERCASRRATAGPARTAGLARSTTAR